MSSNRLMLDPSKSEFTWCASQRRTHLTVKSASVLPDELVNVLSSLGNLGAYFDESMFMTGHVNRLARSCFDQLRRIIFSRLSLTITVATRLVNSFIIARVDYCNSILAGLPKYQLSRIQSVPNVAARIVYDQARFEHITPTLRDRLHWLRVTQRIDFKRCLLVFKALHGLAPVYIKTTVSKSHQDGVSGLHHTVASSFLHLLRQFCSVNVLSWSEARVCGTTCRSMSSRPDPSSCLSRDLKPTYLDNLLRYRLLLNFVTVPLTLVATMLRRLKHGLNNNKKKIIIVIIIIIIKL